MLNREEILAILEKTNVLRQGHFRYTSGRHGERYLQCAQLLQYPEYAGLLCSQLAQQFGDEDVELVVGPALGGIIIAYEVARALGVRTIFAEREEGQMALRRGFQVQPGERVLVVEDVMTTGGSVREVIELVEKQGGQVVGVGTLLDRSQGRAEFGVKTAALLEIQLNDYDPEECPLCAQGLPLVKPGSRKV